MPAVRAPPGSEATVADYWALDGISFQLHSWLWALGFNVRAELQRNTQIANSCGYVAAWCCAQLAARRTITARQATQLDIVKRGNCLLDFDDDFGDPRALNNTEVARLAKHWAPEPDEEEEPYVMLEPMSFCVFVRTLERMLNKKKRGLFVAAVNTDTAPQSHGTHWIAIAINIS